MEDQARKLQTDVAVVGSGPGGATVARELAKQGKKVVILERGKNPKWTGNLFSTFFIMDKRSLLFPKGSVRVGRALTTGGSSAIYCGTAVPPPDWIKAKYKIDLSEFVEEARREIGIKPLPERLIGPASRRIMEAARDVGINWNPLDKFIDAEKCELKCPHCMLGCNRGAIWTARKYVEEAVDSGATLINQALVQRGPGGEQESCRGQCADSEGPTHGRGQGHSPGSGRHGYPGAPAARRHVRRRTGTLR